MEGSFAAVTGPSGSGKTTFFNFAAGPDDPTSGRVSVQGKRFDSMDMVQRSKFRLTNMGFVFQAFNLLQVLTARENVEFGSLLRRVPAVEAKENGISFLFSTHD